MTVGALTVVDCKALRDFRPFILRPPSLTQKR